MGVCAVMMGVFSALAGTVVTGITGSKALGAIAGMATGGLGALSAGSAAAAGASAGSGSFGSSLLNSSSSLFGNPNVLGSAASGMAGDLAAGGFGSAIGETAAGSLISGATGSGFGSTLGNVMGDIFSSGSGIYGNPNFLGSAVSGNMADLAGYTGFDPAIGMEFSPVSGAIHAQEGQGLFTQTRYRQARKVKQAVDALRTGIAEQKQPEAPSKSGSTGDIGKAIGGITQGIIGGNQDVSGREGANAADPWGPNRARYIDQLNKLMADPSSITTMPGYQAGLDAVQRAGAAQGYTGSGFLAGALAQYGGQQYQQTLNNLMALAGVTSSSPSEAGRLLASGQVNQAQLEGNALNSILYGGSALWNAFSGKDKNKTNPLADAMSGIGNKVSDWFSNSTPTPEYSSMDDWFGQNAGEWDLNTDFFDF